MGRSSQAAGAAAPSAALPMWSAADVLADRPVAAVWPLEITREWAWGGSTGRGVRVCIIDSGVQPDHPLVGPIDGAMTADLDDEGRARIVRDTRGDVSGHGTACAGIVRSLAPDCAIHSMRVLGSSDTGVGAALLAGVAWAVDQGFDVINLSLSTRRRDLAETLHDFADTAYFRRSILVCSAHNAAVRSYPWRFASVISVGSHDDADPERYLYNPQPPVEFLARGVEVEVAWHDGGTTTATGNSFATPHIAGICARILSKHPGLTPFELKSLLFLTASNVESQP